MDHSDDFFMQIALEEARKSALSQEIPVGAVAVMDKKVLAKAGNMPIATRDPTAHAELLVLRMAAQHLGNYRIPTVSIYVTLEPCAMCYGAMVHARIDRLVFGASDPKSGVLGGAVSLTECKNFNHKINLVGGVLEADCSALLKTFFAGRRL